MIENTFHPQGNSQEKPKPIAWQDPDEAANVIMKARGLIYDKVPNEVHFVEIDLDEVIPYAQTHAVELGQLFLTSARAQNVIPRKKVTYAIALLALEELVQRRLGEGVLFANLMTNREAVKALMNEGWRDRSIPEKLKNLLNL